MNGTSLVPVLGLDPFLRPAGDPATIGIGEELLRATDI